jgi:hypothetical protein
MTEHPVEWPEHRRARKLNAAEAEIARLREALVACRDALRGSLNQASETAALEIIQAALEDPAEAAERMREAGA